MNLGRLAERYLKGGMTFGEFMTLAQHDPSDKEAAELIDMIEHQSKRGGFLDAAPQVHDRHMARIHELIRLITSRRSDAESDWRLQGQERYLAAAELVFRQYRRNLRDENWDHDHCAFCWAKFMVEGWPEQ